MKNDDNECFRWCHIRHLNPQEKDTQRIKKTDRKMVQELNYQGLPNHVTTKGKEVDHNLWVWGSVPRALRARGSPAIMFGFYLMVL